MTKVPRGTTSIREQGADPVAEKNLKDLIAQAKANRRERGPDLSGVPAFDQPFTPPAEERPALSDKTRKGLEAINEAAKERLPPKVEKSEEEPEELTEGEKVRAAVEERCSELDIGAYLMGGELLQRVPVVPGKLEVVFRTITDLEETYIDSDLENYVNAMDRKFIRAVNEWSLAAHLHSVNGQSWPSTIDGDGTVNDESMKVRLKRVRKLHTPVMNMLLANLAWFLDRVNNALTVETLGNG